MKQRLLPLLLLFPLAAPAFARGIGTSSLVLDENGKIVADLGDTFHDQLDIDNGMIYRYADGVITASSFAHSDKALWTSNVEIHDNRYPFMFQVSATLLVFIEQDRIVGIDKQTGKHKYRVDSTALAFPLFKRGILYAVDDATQRVQSPGKNDADWNRPKEPPTHTATLSKFDLLKGEWIWSVPFRTAEDKNILISTIQHDGLIESADGKTYAFDPATGKPLKDLPKIMPTEYELYTHTGHSPAPPTLTAEQSALIDKTLTPLYKEHFSPTLAGDTVVFTTALKKMPGNDTLSADIVAFSLKTNKELWRFPHPPVPNFDQKNITVRPCKGGYLVEFSWMVYD